MIYSGCKLGQSSLTIVLNNEEKKADHKHCLIFQFIEEIRRDKVESFDFEWVMRS